MHVPNVTQIILGFFTLAMAILLIVAVWVAGDSINGSYLGSQLVIASIGFVIVILGICQIVIVV
jgi:hypothetical protein